MTPIAKHECQPLKVFDHSVESVEIIKFYEHQFWNLNIALYYLDILYCPFCGERLE